MQTGLAKFIDKSTLKRKVVLGAFCLNPSIMKTDALRESRVTMALEEFVVVNQVAPAEGDHTLNALSVSTRLSRKK